MIDWSPICFLSFSQEEQQVIHRHQRTKIWKNLFSWSRVNIFKIDFRENRWINGHKKYQAWWLTVIERANNELICGFVTKYYLCNMNIFYLDWVRSIKGKPWRFIQAPHGFNSLIELISLALKFSFVFKSSEIYEGIIIINLWASRIKQRLKFKHKITHKHKILMFTYTEASQKLLM